MRRFPLAFEKIVGTFSNMECPCGSSLLFSDCCSLFIDGTQLPETAEQLMRSRYSAFTVKNAAYIEKTLTPESRKGFDLAQITSSMHDVSWKGLVIHSTAAGKAADKLGTVKFTATYEYRDELVEHHETSQFRKDEGGQWYFVDGKVEKPPSVRVTVKIGRNELCPCGSQKKFKKCCARV